MSDELHDWQRKSEPFLMAGIFLGFQIFVSILTGIWIYMGGLL